MMQKALRMPLPKVAIDTSNLIHCVKPVAVAGEKAAKGCLWPTTVGHSP